MRLDCIVGPQSPWPWDLYNWSGFSPYVVATSLRPSREKASPATLWSTSIHRSTLPVVRSSSPIRDAGRFRSRTAAVFIPGATATHDHLAVRTYLPVSWSSR